MREEEQTEKVMGITEPVLALPPTESQYSGEERLLSTYAMYAMLGLENEKKKKKKNCKANIKQKNR